MDDSFDLAVVGAGPAGSRAARLVAEQGARVLLLEKARFPGELNVCGGGMPGCLEAKLALDEPVVEKRVFENRVEAFGAVARLVFDQPRDISVLREVFDQHLARQAAAAGACLLNRRLVRRADVKARTLEVTNLDTGLVETYGFRLVLFADGPRTLALDAAGCGFAPTPENSLLALEWDLEGGGLHAFEFRLEFERLPLGYYWVFPKRDTLNVGVGSTLGVPAAELRACLEEFLAADPRLAQRRVLRRRGGLIPWAMAKRFAAPGALAAGDAAGLVNPLTGAGLVYALWSGERAAATVIDALRSQDPARAVLAYDRRLRLS
ncbi:MAG TPA: geranylgeranyl reductase family protein, partial [Vicinamibacteria bacterium]|nr:geranylgeranyl reductase family protein [Vicinamibacteria bacterium]